MRGLRAAFVLALVLASMCALASSAGAAAVFTYDIQIDDGAYSPAPLGNARISGLDTTKTTRVIVSPPTGPNRYDSGTIALGVDYFATPDVLGLVPGDTIHVRQPAASVAATESFVIPPIELTPTVGASSLTGSLPVGLSGAVLGDYRCNDQPVPTKLTGGPFAIPHSAILPGEKFQINAASAAGDFFSITRHAPGETPCVEVDAWPGTPPPTGGNPDPTPFQISADGMNAIVAPSVRVVLRRGATILSDNSADSTYLSKNISAQALPGDVVDIYRPKTAPAPSASRTIPAVSAVFDPTVDLVAIDSPAAGMLLAGACHVYSCSNENNRVLRDVPAGRNFLDFKVAQGRSGPLDLRPDDRLLAVYDTPDHSLAYTFQGVAGDLVAPQQSLKLASKLKLATLLKALKKGYKVKLKSNEAGTAKLALTLPAATTSAKKKAKTVTLATAVKAVKVGTNTVTLKFTKSGKKALKKLSKKRTRSVVLTSTVTDASGNASTIAKKAKLKP